MNPITPIKREDETLGTFYQGRILVLQKKKGYRFSVDAPLLADFIHTKHSDELLELGTGSGIISLLLSIKPFKHITALEIQESLADMARRNVSINKLESKIRVVREDLRQYRPEKKFDIIFSNPPYIRLREGHLSSVAEKSIAKHELKCDIFDIMQKAKELLKGEGRAHFVFSTKRKEDFDRAVERNDLRMKTLRFVKPHQEGPPNQFLAECDFSSEKEALLPPLILYDREGEYTPEAQKIFSGRIDAASFKES